MRFGRQIALPLASICVLLFVVFAWIPVRSEHAYIKDDWRGILQYLEQNARDGDTIVALSMKFANGFNLVGSSLPYYLDKRTINRYTLLHGNRLGRTSMADFKDSTGKIWIVLFDYQFNMEGFEEQGFTPK